MSKRCVTKQTISNARRCVSEGYTKDGSRECHKDGPKQNAGRMSKKYRSCHKMCQRNRQKEYQKFDLKISHICQQGGHNICQHVQRKAKLMQEDLPQRRSLSVSGTIPKYTFQKFPRRYARKSVDGRLVWMLAVYATWIVVCIDWFK